jgi:benzoyl-CoA reductase/2-hydroxyglutaryl-CoA dehydratase subunit BcrC/BadD/HgdB
MGNAHYFGKPDEYENMLDELIEELSALKAGEYNEAKVKLVWTGARGQEFNIFEAIDNAGGAVLGWCIPNDLEKEFDESKEPFEALVDFELGNKFVGTSLDQCKALEKVLKRYEAKGTILYQYMGCSFGTIDAEYERKYFKEKDIPALSLIGSFDVGEPTGQVVTRVKAFIEMLS